MAENYLWNVIYRNNKHGHENDLGGFANINLDKVKAVQLIPQVPGLPQHVVILDSKKGQRLILFRRRVANIDPNKEITTNQETIHCIGWQQTIGEQNVKSYLWVFEDGSCLMTDTDIAELED